MVKPSLVGHSFKSTPPHRAQLARNARIPRAPVASSRAFGKRFERSNDETNSQTIEISRPNVLHVRATHAPMTNVR